MTDHVGLDYLIDLVAGASLAVLTFYLLMTDEMRAMAPSQTGLEDDFVSSYPGDAAERAIANKLPSQSSWKRTPSDSLPQVEEHQPLSHRGSESDDVETSRNRR